MGAVAVAIAAPPLTALVASRSFERATLQAVDQGLDDTARAAAQHVEAVHQAAEDRLVAAAEDPLLREVAYAAEPDAALARPRLAAASGLWFDSAQVRSSGGDCVVAWPRAECAGVFPAPTTPTDERGVFRKGTRLRCARVNPPGSDPHVAGDLGQATVCVDLGLEHVYRGLGAVALGRGLQVDLLDSGGRPAVVTAGRSPAVRLESTAVRVALARASGRGLVLPGADGTTDWRSAWTHVPTAGLGVLTSTTQDAARAPVNERTRAVTLLSTILSLLLAGCAFRVAQRARAVSRVVEDERRSAEERALTDVLTGLNNRAALDAALAAAVADAGPGRSPAVIVVDLDGFKSINDSRGHEAGDHALRAIAHAIRMAARSGDFVARLGGDEFAVIVPDGSSDGVRELAARLETVIDGLGIAADVRRGALVGGSAGWARLNPGEDAPALLRRADAAMYERKAFRKSTAGRRAGRTNGGA